MPGRQCCVPWCRGDEVMVAVGKDAIQELKKWPCQYTKKDVEVKVKSYSSDKPDYICLTQAHHPYPGVYYCDPSR